MNSLKKLVFAFACFMVVSLTASAALPDDPVMPFVREWGEHAASMKNGFGARARQDAWRHGVRPLCRTPSAARAAGPSRGVE